MNNKNKVSFFIDGFNLYHSIRMFNKQHLKWLDLQSLCKKFIGPNEVIESINYFTAKPYWLTEAVQRQDLYLQALNHHNVNVVLGHFKEQTKRCKKCGVSWIAHEEKETDVNIALSILDFAYQDKFNTAILISADTDFVPVLSQLKISFPRKNIRILIPPNIRYNKKELSKFSSRITRIKQIHIQTSLLPEEIETLNQNVILKPEEYS